MSLRGIEPRSSGPKPLILSIKLRALDFTIHNLFKTLFILFAMRLDKKFWATAFTLTGTVIGAGILGLPYVFAKSGFFVGLFWLIFLGIITIYFNLALGEVTLRTKGVHHLPGLAEKYLGKTGKKIMFFAMAFGIYSALLAYLVGEGESLSKIIFGNSNYALHLGFVFWIGMTFLLREGLKGLKKVETWGVIVIILIILGIFVWMFPQANFGNLNSFDKTKLFFPFGVVLFSLLGFSSIPELRREIKGKEKYLKKAIIVGMLIPVVLYILFAFSFVSVLGNSVPEVATLAFGNIILLLGIFTMMTSYFVLSFALKEVFTYDFYERKFIRFFFVSIFPIILYFVIIFFKFTDFVNILNLGGVVSGGLSAILILIMNLKAKKLGNRKPEYSIKINWFIIVVLSIVFLLGVFSFF